MTARFAPEQPAFITPWLTFAGIKPIVNGTVVDPLNTRAHALGLDFDLSTLAGKTTMGIAVQTEGEICWLRVWLDALPVDFQLRSFGLRFELNGSLRAFLRNGYFSWDGSYYVQLDQPVERVQGYAMTQLLPLEGAGSVVLGFERHDRFQTTFTLELRGEGSALSIETLWDEKTRTDSRIESERLALFDHTGIEGALEQWAELVAKATRPRLDVKPISGWCSWYNLYASITEANILEHLEAARMVTEQEQLPLWVFQIDDGFTPEMGDWLDVKPQFPRGIKPVLDDIRAAGFTPGLWIAPFLVGNRSRLYAEHPDWVVRDRLTGGPLAHMTFYGEFRWHKRSEEYYILDTTHPDALAYLAEVFHVWHDEWGCDYFKTDFMQFGSEYGPDRALWHTPGMTRIEIWRRTAETIRVAIGEAVWLGCGCPLWASVGLVDAVRIGRDVGVSWQGERFSAQSLLRDQATRNFGNGRLWQADPDCILLRERFHHLTDAEVRTLALYAGMSGGLAMTSDHLGELSSERLRLWRLIVSPVRAVGQFPRLGLPAPGETYTPDPIIVQVRHAAGPLLPAAVFILNTSDATAERTFTLAELGLSGGLFGYNWMTAEPSAGTLEALAVILAPHDGVLWFLKDEPWEGRPERLP